MSPAAVIRKLSPANVRRSATARLQHFSMNLRRTVIRNGEKGGWRTWLHFHFVRTAHSREAAAVIAGQSRYAQDHRSAQSTYMLLRRNVHRLEKGLIMRPRRPVFAADYIGETVDIYARALSAVDASDPGPEVGWAADVLETYFDAVDTSDPRIAPVFERFKAVSAPSSAGTGQIPFLRDLARPSPVQFEAFQQLCRRRRSVRWYRDEPVPRWMIDQAIEAAGQAPSACNRQPFVFRILDDKEEARRVASIPGGTKGFAEHLPAVAVLVGRLRAYPHERDRHAIYVDGALAAMSFIFALETMELASCSINWPDQEPHESRMRAAMGLEPDERVIMLIGFGWPDQSGMVPYSSKRPLAQLRSYN